MEKSREILFRGKQIDGRGWIEGCLFIDYVMGKYYIHADGNSVKESEKKYGKCLLRFAAYEINPATVCQYTGLTDKNSRKIFCGDICRYFNEEDKDGIAEIKDDYAYWRGGTIRKKDIMTPLFHLQCSEEWEIVGNVFDNPEELAEEIEQYQAIGTVKECREAREKQKPKKAVKDEYSHDCCSNCGWIVYKNAYGGRYLPHCENCGQAIDWSGLGDE